MLTLCHNYFQVTPNSKNNKDVVQHQSKKKFVFGVFILFLVSVLWVVSSEFTKVNSRMYKICNCWTMNNKYWLLLQYLYIEKKIERPFLVSYIRCSLLFIYLIVLCFSPPTRDPCRPADYTVTIQFYQLHSVSILIHWQDKVFHTCFTHLMVIFPLVCQDKSFGVFFF